VIEPAKKERAKSEAVEQKSTMLTVQVLWGCQAYNATPEEAAQRVVADLFVQLSQGGSVPVHVEELGGEEYTLEVTANTRPFGATCSTRFASSSITYAPSLRGISAENCVPCAVVRLCMLS
jgi:hypothetical protein